MTRKYELKYKEELHVGDLVLADRFNIAKILAINDNKYLLQKEWDDEESEKYEVEDRKLLIKVKLIINNDQEVH